MIPAHLKVHTVQIADYQGATTFGDAWAPPRTVSCWAEGTTKLVVNALGEQVISSAQVYVDPGDECPLKSRVTWNGAPRTVIALAIHDSGGLTQLDHVELMLQ